MPKTKIDGRHMEATISRDEITQLGAGDYAKGLALLMDWHRKMQANFPNNFPFSAGYEAKQQK
jgi:hypothetical protein